LYVRSVMESSVNSRLREWAFIARRRRRLLTELGGPVDIERVPALWPRTGTDGGRDREDSRSHTQSVSQHGVRSRFVDMARTAAGAARKVSSH
jgi:hypothetical protein